MYYSFLDVEGLMAENVVVLGAGIVGSAMAVDLSKKYQVRVADINPQALQRLENMVAVSTVQADLSDPDVVKSVINDCDLVIGAVPGYMGYATLRSIIEAGKDVVDISFFAEDPFTLDELAKEKGVTAVIDCGVAPGMGNIIHGYHHLRMQVKSYQCYVGGLPVIREWPFEYKAVFSPIDVIEEYVRPARLVEGERVVLREALSDAELMYFEEVGTLEAWNSDGLRTMVRTMRVPEMKEKTLRYPGTIEYLKMLREMGFFSSEEIEVRGQKIRPLDLTAKLLFPRWKMEPGEEDLTIMKIIISGLEQNTATSYQYDLYDRYDPKTGTISMARTTGYTATAVANLVLAGRFERNGICPPEYVGIEEENFRFILDYLKERGVVYRVKRITV
jgi:lysine 6-dehydrogenase